MGEGKEGAHNLQRERAGGVTGWREERKERRESLLAWGGEAVCAEPPHQDFYPKGEREKRTRGFRSYHEV